jgi:peptide-methionine (S)-S-oxide reductase
MAERRLERATLAGGCFWCLEAVFEQLAGVEQVVSGYAGGETDDPTYEAVCSGRTGHAEAVQIAYDPAVVPYHDLLGVFFSIHDPTTLNRQGGDAGTQYRSAIFHHDERQKAAAEAFLAELERERVFDDEVVTELVPLERFWPAETYHQGYFRAHPEQGYCSAVISPKVAEFRRKYAARLKG